MGELKSGLKVGAVLGFLVAVLDPGISFAQSQTAISAPDSNVPPERLSVDQAVRFGLAHHPKLFWFRHGVRVQDARVGVAKSHFYPHVGAGVVYGISNPGLTDRPFNNNNFIDPLYPMSYAAPGNLAFANEPMLDATMGVNQMLYDFGKFEHRVKERLAGRKASEFWLYSQDAWVILQVKEAYYHVLLDRTLVTVYRKNLEQRKLVMELTGSLYRAGYRSELDFDFARVDDEKARALLVTEQNDLVTQIARLNDRMGLGQAGRRDYLLSDSLEGENRLVASDLAISRGLTYRPEINAFRNLYKKDTEQARYERAQHYPLISAFGSYGFLGNMVTGQSYAPGGGWWSGGGSVTIPLTTGGQIRSLTRRDREKAREREYGITDWSHNIRYQIVRAHSRVRSDIADIKAYTEAVREAKLALVLATKRYSANLISIVDLTLAEVYLLDTEAKLALYQYQYQADFATLRFAEGVDYLAYLPKVRKKVVGMTASGR